MGFNKRKWWPIGDNKSISIETAGWKSTPHIIFEIEPEERKVMFSIAFGFAIYISINGFIPRSWFPTMSYTKGGTRYPEERSLSIKIHGGAFWWNFWVSEQWSSYCANKTWRMGSFHYMDKIKGKHDYQRKETDRRQFILPFLEGIYNVEVINWARTDKYAHWPTSRMTTWEVRAGYYDEETGEWKDKPIPVEGKGENSYDCDEDATWSISFPGPPYKKDVNTPYLAALYFWHSMMRSREQRGSERWLPEKFKDRKIEVIK